jgi:hypothetical protein
LGLSQGPTRYSQKTLGFLKSHSSTVAGKFAYSLAALLAVLVLPLAVQAVTGSNEPEETNSAETQPESNNSAGPNDESDSYNNSNIETSVDVSNEANEEGQVNGNNVEVTIDGEDVPVPPSGQVHKKKSTNSTESIVDISIQGSQSGSSHTDIKINNQHYSSDDEDDSEGGRLDNHR